jgi:hypothetical protein
MMIFCFMSGDLEERLSFVRRVHQNELDFFIDKLSKYSGYLISRARRDGGVIICGENQVPFKFEMSRGFVGLSFNYDPSDASIVRLKNDLREALIKYFTGKEGPRDFLIPFNVPLSDSDVQNLFSSLRSELSLKISLDGKTRLLMRNGRMCVEGSLSKKPHVLAFSCAYEGATCRALNLHVPFIDEGIIRFYKEIEGFVESYHPPQRL